MRERREFLNFLDQHSHQTYLVLAELIETEGSTYRKKGAKKIIGPDGSSCGLMSGGCLEAEIVNRALSMEQLTESFSLDTQEEGDRLFGSNLGCRGRMTIQLSKMDAASLREELFKDPLFSESLEVHIVGLGPDTDSLKELLQWTGWHYSFYSTQRDRVQERQEAGWTATHFRSAPVPFNFNNEARSAVILMSHNYSTDLEVLAQLSQSSVAWIGVLGPAARRQSLLTDLKGIYNLEVGADFSNRLHGPIGLPGMGKGDQGIALSVVADLQARFFGDF